MEFVSNLLKHFNKIRGFSLLVFKFQLNIDFGYSVYCTLKYLYISDTTVARYHNNAQFLPTRYHLFIFVYIKTHQLLIISGWIRFRKKGPCIVQGNLDFV